MICSKTEFSVNSSVDSVLPSDIVQEILLRLPVKTLLRFKCVSKHWYALIESCSFANEHYGHESNQERLLVRHYDPNESRYTFALYVDETCSRYEEPNYLQLPNTVDDLMGPVNGIFCVLGLSRGMGLLNPAVRQFKPLPECHLNVQPHLCSVDNVFGFGLDPITGDFKLVEIEYFWDEDRDIQHDCPLVSIYNSGNDSWRHFEDVGLDSSTYCANRSLCNTFLDGYYYWLMEFENADIAAVLAFNMNTEVFEELEVPCSVKSKKKGDLSLYGDSVVLLSYDLDSKDKIDQCIDVWVLTKDRSWIKSITVGPLEEIGWPLGFWKNNELLLETGTSILALYNLFTQKLRNLDSGGNEGEFFAHWVYTYKESLVSIEGEGGTDNCMLWDASSDFVKYFLGV